MRRLFPIAFLIISVLAFTQCKQPKIKSGYEEVKDLAEWVKPLYSNLFLIGTFGGDTFLILKDPADTSKELGAYCWGIGSRSFQKIKRFNANLPMVITSAVFAGMMESLHTENKIIGIDNGDYLSSPRTAKLYKNGKIANVAKSGELSQEAVARLKPGLLIGYYIEPKGKENLLRAETENMPVMFFQNYLENHPLGRAEWIKVFGYLTGKPKEALDQFAEIEEHYLSTSARVEEAKSHPGVLINAPFSGTWDIPAGKSYMATLIADAGGNYLWASQPGTGRIALDIEKVYTHASLADIWLNPGACRSISCLMTVDPRIAKFKAFKSGEIYNCSKTLNEKGANAYWDYGVLRPDLVLLDLVKIFHPELAEDHQEVFFEKLKNN